MFKPKFTITPKINKALVEKDILKKVGEKKGAYYILAQKLVGKIRDIKGHT
ncbi:MAG: hypothetical protein J7M11_03600 [Elusimicrobia bacterium]|nr:hypothetical protein [Elusimicrobiota bacterium]